MTVGRRPGDQQRERRRIGAVANGAVDADRAGTYDPRNYFFSTCTMAMITPYFLPTPTAPSFWLFGVIILLETQFYSHTTLPTAHTDRLNFTYFTFSLSIIFTQLLIALSPLLALFYIIYTGFEPEEVERKKREQTGDFQLDGHAD